MVKLIIQIPSYNEEKTLAQTVHDLPKMIVGVDIIEYLVIDDGSDDKTLEVAKQCKVHHLLPLKQNQGLAKAFIAGIQLAIEKGADIVVNTDADNQYCGEDIIKLVQPILHQKADIVIGERPIKDHKEFSFTKKFLQRVGSYLIRILSGVQVNDATSGFRAFSRETCKRLQLYTDFSHCAETLIQAGHLGLRVASVNIRVNQRTRESRLFRHIPQYLYYQGKTILLMFIMYRPGTFFFLAGSLVIFIAGLLGVRFLYLVYWMPTDNSRTYVPSLILLSIFCIFGFVLWVLAIIGELIKFNRIATEKLIYLQCYNNEKK